MEQEMLTANVEQADLLLQSIRGGILIYVTQSGSPRDLEAPLHVTRHLRDIAPLLETAEATGSVERLEKRLSRLAAGADVFSDDEARDLLDLLAEVEAAIGRVRMGVDSTTADVSEFVDESFESLQRLDLSAFPQPVEFASEPAAFDEFEIDAEMLEIFGMEAEDLLKNIDVALAALAQDPNDHDALWDIRRNAHTFKGAAGIVGLKKISALAHRIEDLLDHLAQHRIAGTREIFDLLTEGTECLKSATTGDVSGSTERLVAIYAKFDALMHRLLTEAEPETAAVGVSVPMPVTADEVVAILETDGLDDDTPRPNQPRSIVRVSLSRLDDLARIVRDLVVSRSVFEQRLSDFDQQIDDLNNSTRRLQKTSNELEINFETSMISSFASGGFAIPGGEALNGFDPLEFDRYTELHQRTRELSETASDTFAIHNALDAIKENIGSLFEMQRRLIEDMQEKLMRIRMVEFGTLATRLHRAVRLTADEEHKLTEVHIENQDQELDTLVLDGLIEPLMHLLRNAVVHGIEPPETRRLLGKPEAGNIRIRLLNEETHIVLKVSDDGRGIAASSLKEKAFLTGLISRERADEMSYEEVIDLIFLPGLTTAERLSLSAGRGVGMSIVRESVEARGGTISIESLPQKGTTFTIRMPLPLAVTNVLHIRSGRYSYAVPVKLVRHVGDVDRSKLKETADGEFVELITGNYPVRYLHRYTGTAPAERSGDQLTLLLVETADATYALIVEEVVKTEEVIIKDLGKPLDGTPGVLGAGVMANGETVPILDLPILLRSKNRPVVPALSPQTDKLSVLIVDDSPSVRHLTSKIIENAGWKAITAKDGLEALDLLRSDGLRPAVILTDVEMPRMDGYEFVNAVTNDELLKHLPLVFITSRSGEKHRLKAAELGVKNYLTKPVDERELVQLIKRLSLAAHA